VSSRDQLNLLLYNVGPQVRAKRQAMTRWILLGVVLLASVNAAAQTLTRAQAQRVVAQRYPGFRILDASDFEAFRQKRIKDGVSGGLIVGRFNFDTTTDFAALIVPAKTTRYEAGSNSYNYYAGQLGVCFGAAAGAFRCEAEDRIITLPQDRELARIPPGR
jgi:hypothetical protein